jgi:N-formylglutamate deformylase
VVNGRFKGGYITRHHGHPAERVHAIQLELCQCLYMDEQAPFDYLPAQADRLQPVLKAMTGAALGAPSPLGSGRRFRVSSAVRQALVAIR